MGATEAKRDLDPTAFTESLRKLWRSSDAVVAVVFVDADGECVDYCSSIDPFEAKIAGAMLLPIMRQVITASEGLGVGTGTTLVIRCEHFEFFVQRVSVDYILVVVVSVGAVDRRLRKALRETALELRIEAGMSAPIWEVSTHQCQVDVELRPAKSWDYAPKAFLEGGIRREISAVLGRWTEQRSAEKPGRSSVLFRVQTRDGRELTLEHRPWEDVWIRYEYLRRKTGQNAT